jgi:hypothetical protein
MKSLGLLLALALALAPPAAAAPAAPTRRSMGGSRCYVGPRGGTDTITASGNKNYSGC